MTRTVRHRFERGFRVRTAADADRIGTAPRCDARTGFPFPTCTVRRVSPASQICRHRYNRIHDGYPSIDVACVRRAGGRRRPTERCLGVARPRVGNGMGGRNERGPLPPTGCRARRRVPHGRGRRREPETPDRSRRHTGRRCTRGVRARCQYGARGAGGRQSPRTSERSSPGSTSRSEPIRSG